MVEASEARSPYTISDVTVIQEVYDSENANEKFEMQLETALDSGVKIIVVEPSRLGDETARWIACGNCLHKTAIFTGLGCFCTGMIWTERPYLCLPFCVVSFLCTTLYTVSWQFDPCCKYQIEQDYSKLPNLPILRSVSQTASVVLVHRDDNRRKVLHTSVSIIAAVFCAWRIYSCK